MSREALSYGEVFEGFEMRTLWFIINDFGLIFFFTLSLICVIGIYLFNKSKASNKGEEDE